MPISGKYLIRTSHYTSVMYKLMNHRNKAKIGEVHHSSHISLLLIIDF